MKKYFLTFSGGDINYFEALRRIEKQAESINLFDKIYAFSTYDLVKDDEFWDTHGNFISNYKRGFGYWLWKPYLILKILDKMAEGDILIYADSGCEIDIRNKKKLLDLIKTINKDLVVGSFTDIEKNWTKKDLITYLEMDDPKYLDTPQHQATVIGLKKCKQVMLLVNLWYKISSKYHYIDDSPSEKQNYPSFQEHRHDQSIFSLLTKKFNLFSKKTFKGVIYMSRNRTGKSKIW